MRIEDGGSGDDWRAILYLLSSLLVFSASCLRVFVVQIELSVTGAGSARVFAISHVRVRRGSTRASL